MTGVLTARQCTFIKTGQNRYGIPRGDESTRHFPGIGYVERGSPSFSDFLMRYSRRLSSGLCGWWLAELEVPRSPWASLSRALGADAGAKNGNMVALSHSMQVLPRWFTSLHVKSYVLRSLSLVLRMPLISNVLVKVSPGEPLHEKQHRDHADAGS